MNDMNKIKNLTSIVHALSTVDGKRVCYEHLEIAAKSNKKYGEDSGSPHAYSYCVGFHPLPDESYRFCEKIDKVDSAERKRG